MSQIKGDISSNGIYYFTPPTGEKLTIKNSNDIPNYNFVLIVDGTVDVDINGDFSPISSIAILANKINFTPAVLSAKGIFVADDANSGITAEVGTSGLKIIGNISSPKFTNNRIIPDNHKPSLFVVADPKQYLDLLQFLSIDKYDWRQLQ